MKHKYIIINKTLLEKRIEELEKDIKFYSNEGKKLEANQCLGAADTLKQIISQSTPLIPIIKNAFYNGGDMKEKEEFDFYISNLKLDI